MSTNNNKQPQALQTGFASRLRLDQTSLFISTVPVARAAKRAAGNNFVSYAEVDEDFDEDFDDDDPAFSSTSSTVGGVSGGGTPAATAAAAPDEVKKLAQKTEHVTYTQAQTEAIADKQETLVPVRLSLEYDGYRVSDFLLWNAAEDVITPEAFAAVMCQDLDLPSSFVSPVAGSIRQQVADYATVAQVDLPQDIGFNVVVSLSVYLDTRLYEDKFEWEMGSDLTPVSFAKQVVMDLGLHGEFYPAIAHALYEVLYRIKKEAMEGHLPQEIENYAAFGGEAGWRVDQEGLGEEWAPTVEVLSQEEIERREIERGRNNRRLKRESARLGEVTDIGGLFGRSKRRRRAYDD